MKKPLYPLEQFNQWIIWRPETKPDGTVDKIPVSPYTLKKSDAHDPTTWASYHIATVAAQSRPGHGLGFVFTENDPFFFLDIDKCLLDTGEWSERAKYLITMTAGAAVEVSQSGRGLHVIGTGTAPDERRIKSPDRTFELYTQGRFIAMSEYGWRGDASVDHTAALHEITRMWLTVQPSSSGVEGWTTEPVDGWNGYSDDDELIQRAINAKSAAGAFGGITFRQLWEADAEACAAKWPDMSGNREYDYSSADAALAQHLAFWTGNNCERIEAIMKQSALVRDKWDREDYLYRTIVGAVRRQSKVYSLPSAEQPDDADGDSEYRVGYQAMTIQGQREYFRDCVYVASSHRILTPNGQMLKPDAFKALYGGYNFSLDVPNEKKTTSAWTAFTESQGYNFPKVGDTCYNPTKPTRQTVTQDGVVKINTYRPLLGERAPGNVEPFTRHLENILPDAGDRKILIDYLASCVQRPGVKSQWAPVIQGTQGNGKTILYHAVEYALGAPHCHQVDPNDFKSSNFNGWIDGKLFICIEEIRIAGKYEFADKLKPLITNRRIASQSKGEDQRTTDNYANFLLFSNYKDAVIKTREDRRYCVFYTAQQSVSDLIKSGMNNRYFHDFFRWFDADGRKYVAEYLHTIEIITDTLGRAPDTSSTAEAYTESLGSVEQHIMAAIDEEEPGLNPVFVDFSAASTVAARAFRNISPHGIGKALKNIGYDIPPAAGRVLKIRTPAGRRRFYVNTESEIFAADIETVRSHILKNL